MSRKRKIKTKLTILACVRKLEGNVMFIFVVSYSS